VRSTVVKQLYKPICRISRVSELGTPPPTETKSAGLINIESFKQTDPIVLIMTWLPAQPHGVQGNSPLFGPALLKPAAAVRFC
jgi:hypothetical protein